MAANDEDLVLVEHLKINVTIQSRGLLGMVVKHIKTEGYRICEIKDYSPFFTAIKIDDIITHWDDIPLMNVTMKSYNKIVQASQKSGQFSLLLTRTSKQKQKKKIDAAGESQNEKATTDTATATDTTTDTITPSDVTANATAIDRTNKDCIAEEKRKDGNDNDAQDKTESDKPISEGAPPVQQTVVRISFDERVEELKKYKEQHGHVNVDVDEASNSSLYHWCASMRYAHRCRNPQPNIITSPETQPGEIETLVINDDRIQKLEELGFVWDPPRRLTADPSLGESISKTTFDQHFEELKKFKKLHGHLDATRMKDESLGNWCRHIKSSYDAMKRGEQTGIKLEEDRIRRLKEIGFLFDSTRIDSYDENFNDNLEQLKKYKAIHGHCNATSKNDEGLAVWVANLKSAYKYKQQGENKGLKLGEDRIRRLEEIGFSFAPQKTDLDFDKYLEEIQAFKEKYGHWNPSIREHVSYTSLAGWCANVRSAYENKNLGQPSKSEGMRLDEDRIRRLEEIGFQWSISDDTNVANVDKMPTTVSQDGTFFVRSIPGRKLGITMRKTTENSGFVVKGIAKDSPLAWKLNVGDILLDVNTRTLGELTQGEFQEMIETYTEAREEMNLKFSRKAKSSDSEEPSALSAETRSSLSKNRVPHEPVVLRSNPMASAQSSQEEIIKNGNEGLNPRALNLVDLTPPSPGHKSIDAVFLPSEVPNINIKALPVCHAFIVGDKESEAQADKMNKKIQKAAKKRNLGKRKIRIACKSAKRRKILPLSTGISNDFPGGWTEEVHKKSNGTTYKYWFSPVKKYKFRAKKTVLLFIDAVIKYKGEDKAFEVMKDSIK